MTSKLNKPAYEQLIREDIDWLSPLPRTLEKDHILDVLQQSVEHYYPSEPLLTWAVERWNAEVKERPLHNIDRRALDDTWRQVIRKLGGDPESLLGPNHSTLLERRDRERK